MFAIIKTGGKQYQVSEGTVLKVEKLAEEARQKGKVVFDEVLLTDDGKETVLGQPIVKGAKVEAEVVTDGRADKIRVVHFKNKIRYHKVYGHRQPFTQIKVTKIA
ncbi:MAG: 50S ribosomal protein L21 [bacterium]|nr:50S ribosomal protein L21 [bacterium]